MYIRWALLPSREHLEDFLAVADQRSIQAAARATGRSRATLARHLAELEALLSAPPLLLRGPGQREGVLTPAGEALVVRARAMLQAWDRWVATTRDEVSRHHEELRVGALGGSLDLVVELVMDLRKEHPELPLHLRELTSAELVEQLAAGAIDLGFGTAPPEGTPRGLGFESLGVLEHAVIAPRGLARRLPDEPSLADLAHVPLVVLRAGALRESLERAFAEHPRGPLPFRPLAEVESTPRVVELVARGLGVAVVSRFRLAFAPPGLVVRALVDGPRPLRAGVYTRTKAPRRPIEHELLERARARFRTLADGPHRR